MIRIQFLRLIHAVADSHANRYFLLSLSEVNELKQSAGKLKLTNSVNELKSCTFAYFQYKSMQIYSNNNMLSIELM